MTRASQVTRALSAMKKERVTRARSERASMRFLIFEHNGGYYCWTLVAASGERLALSMRFASRQEATRAARIVRAGAGSALIEDDAPDTRTADLAARVKAVLEPDDLDAERWLDEGGRDSTGEATPKRRDTAADSALAQPAAVTRTDPDHQLKARERSTNNKHLDVGKGRLKEAAGSLTGDKHLKNEGRRDQAKASARNTVDKIVDTLPGRGTE